MGNLGMYQRMTTWSKILGGPVKFMIFLCCSGAVVAAPIAYSFGLKKGKEEKRKVDKNNEFPAVFMVKKTGVSNEGVEFRVGDRFRVIGRDMESVLIEIIGNDNNPYFVHADFLEQISDFRIDD